MFTWLYRILLITVIIIAIFFVVSSLVFSGRLAEGMQCRDSAVLLLNLRLGRLWRQIMESAVVVA